MKERGDFLGPPRSTDKTTLILLYDYVGNNTSPRMTSDESVNDSISIFYSLQETNIVQCSNRRYDRYLTYESLLIIGVGTGLPPSPIV